MSDINLPALVVEVDPNNHLSTGGSAGVYTATAAGLVQNEVAYQYIDYGAGYFNASGWMLWGLQNITGMTGANYEEFALAFSGDKTTLYALQNSISIDWYGVNHTNIVSYLQEMVGGAAGAGAPGTYTYSASSEKSFYLVYDSGLGQYGGYWFVGANGGEHIFIRATAIPSFRYLMPIVGANSGTTDTVSGYFKSLDLTMLSAGLDLTTFTETDPNGRFVQYANCSVITALNGGETASVHKDYGAGYFSGNYELKGMLVVDSMVSSGGDRLGLLSVSKALGNVYDNSGKHGIVLNYVSSTTFNLKIIERIEGSSLYSSTGVATLAVNYPYPIRLRRDITVGTYGTLYLEVGNDPLFTSLLTSTSLTLHSEGGIGAYRYFNPIQSFDYASRTSLTTTFTFGGVSVDLTIPTTGTIEVTENRDTVAITGNINPPTIGQVVVAERRDVVSILGYVPTTGIISISERRDVILIQMGIPVVGSINISERRDSVAIAGTLASVSISEPINIRALHKTSGSPLLGLTTVQLKVTDPNTGYLLDFFDHNFKAAPTEPYTLMQEVNATNQPGLYSKLIPTSPWSGWFIIEATYDDGSYTYSWEQEAYYVAGIRVTGAAPTTIEIINALSTHVVAGILTFDQAMQVIMAILAGKVHGASTSVEKFRDIEDTYDIAEFHVDSLGNRTSVILDI